MISPSKRSSGPSTRWRVEQPGQADLVGLVLDLGGLALARRGVLGERVEIGGRRIVARAELAQERAVADDVGIAADRAR